MHINSVGTARRDQREIDPETFQRSKCIIVDTKEGVFGEAGDAVAARDVIREERVHDLATLVAGKTPGRTSDQDITLFKSVGTGIQDIALAAVIYRRAVEAGLGRELGEFPYLSGNRRRIDIAALSARLLGNDAGVADDCAPFFELGQQEALGFGSSCRRDLKTNRDQPFLHIRQSMMARTASLSFC